MSRLIAIFLAGLAVVGRLEAISFGKQAELHVYHLSVSPGDNELLREPLHEVQPVTLRADAGDSLAIELDPLLTSFFRTNPHGDRLGSTVRCPRAVNLAPLRVTRCQSLWSFKQLELDACR
jgi:hypothetical protein